jgi:mannose-6-phosphate isomerase
MGTHPNGPTELADQKQTPLKDYLKEHAYMLGEHEGGDLQFLFKVLSVGKPLSLQSHPTKVTNLF